MAKELGEKAMEMSDTTADPNRIARDYAIMRLEFMEASDLVGYTDQDLRDLSSDFHDAQMKILCSIDSAGHKHELRASTTFERKYKEVKRRLLQMKGTQSTSSSYNTNNRDTLAKLPKITIKVFDGSLENWISFKELYDSLIHSRDIPNVQKLHYLLSSVQGTAYDLIKSFPLMDESYAPAYDTLLKYYDKKCQVAMTYYDKLVHCEPVKFKSGRELERVYRTFSENLSILEKYKLPDKNFMLFYLLWSKLDKSTREQFQLEHNSNEVPKFEIIQSFVEKHYKALEMANSKLPNVSVSAPKNTGSSNTKNKSKPVLIAQSSTCPHCSGQHTLTKCDKFLKLNVDSRFKFIKEKGLCVLCFSDDHRVRNCRDRSRCGVCNYSHNTLLHFGKVTPSAPVAQMAEVSPEATVLTSTNNNYNTVLFSTVRILVKDKSGEFLPIRALLDCASACNFITEPCAKRLGLEINHSQQAIHGIGHSTTTPLGHIQCEVKPVLSNKPINFNIEALVLPSICADLPIHSVDFSGWSHINNLSLADPDFSRPGPIDMLLNADMFASCLLPGLRRGKPGQPNALNTIFGWVVMGGCDNVIPSDGCRFRCRHDHNKNNNVLLSSIESCEFSNLSLDNSLRRFWELENVGTSDSTYLSKEDQTCENNFVDNHFRNSDGRYVVPLPFIDPDNKPEFYNSREIANKRLQSLERKLNANPDLYKAYCSFMEEYESSGHMIKADPPSSSVGKFYYIPHHGVLRPDSVTTPLRVVFDASAKDARGVSLNDTLLAGPKLQTNIFDLLVRFRWHSVVFTGDVKQMYRQILSRDEDIEYQRILWRPSPVGPVLDYKLRTVTYGVSSAPFQALRTMAQLANDSVSTYPHGAEVLSRDIYVDDVVSGAESVEKALIIRSELTQMLSSAGFHLRKITSNDQTFLADLPSSELYSESFKRFEDISDVSLKILGLRWVPQSDSFQFKVAANENRRCTKRTILSEIARIYDPLGFLSPVTFYAKYIMQLLWASGVSWDDEVPENISSEWSRFMSQLPSLSSIAIPRRMLRSFVSLQLHGFCDASERGYCAVIYCRVVDADGTCSVYFCCAKSRVAPLRKLSIPRLELQAAVLLADLMKSTVDALKPFHTVEEICAWSDSSVALSWIKSCPSRWKTFVANRVSHIQDIIPPDCWRHVSTLSNPADCGSRGMIPSELVGQDIWWNGPSWLSDPEDSWPLSSLEQVDLQEEQKIFSFIATTDMNVVENLINKFSSLSTLKHVMSYIFRFVVNSRESSARTKVVGPLQVDEVNKAFMFLIKHAQQNAFSQEIDLIKKGLTNSLPKSLRKLSLFLDEAGLLRVGGRLAHADAEFDVKHPLLLPRTHRLTSLIIEEYHRKLMHPGAQTLQNILAQSFWILSPKRAIRSVISGCLQCFRANPKPAPAPLMGDLPSYRVNKIKPFSSVAIDYGGPFDIALGRGRGVKTYKAYICVFVCTCTKAVHVELATELTTEAFLAALKRFIARRGRCSNIVSDQGRNFVGASNYLGSLMQNAAHAEEIKFSFNPPGSPHFNGLAEAGIKSFKTHLSRVVGTQRLTYEEFYTVLTQVESMLNSRPLTPLSSDANDFSALTPGHFLTLEPLSSLPEEDFVDKSVSPLHRWKLIQKLHQDFWRRWQQEYIHTLQQRTKWTKSESNIVVGTLVLIINEQTCPLQWNMGRIMALHPGPDGVCRVVTVKTATGEYRRPVVKLCPLPIDQN